MEAQRLLVITACWSLPDGHVPETVPRAVTLPQRLRDSLVLAVQGVRRCGKSTPLEQVMARYRLNPRHCAFLDFEDPRLGQGLDHSQIDRWVAAFRSAHPRLDQAYFFLDAVQGVTGWEPWLRTRLERPKDDHFVVTTDRGIVPIQVGWEEPTERHHRALEAFYQTLPHAQEARMIGPGEFAAGALAELAPSG